MGDPHPPRRLPCRASFMRSPVIIRARSRTSDAPFGWDRNPASFIICSAAHAWPSSTSPLAAPMLERAAALPGGDYHSLMLAGEGAADERG